MVASHSEAAGSARDGTALRRHQDRELGASIGVVFGPDAATLGGKPEVHRMQLARALGRAGRHLGLDEVADG